MGLIDAEARGLMHGARERGALTRNIGGHDLAVGGAVDVEAAVLGDLQVLR
ncbi:hypothetical protein [Streptomyces ipomoeae]|uniref:hypothetical protein n=1 Tax=Streptomyces ipomoeae TaxID=103232 RepID=UPI0015F0B168|nr:hypothetical protein [Streptomyces ipomoeae]MDX2939219.1 hypothetical protein [Streptomyces ipomoeae]